MSVSPICKFVGKLYVDRPTSNRPDKEMLLKAVRVIKAKAPKHGKPQVAFMMTPAAVQGGRTRPAALIGRLPAGQVVLAIPLLVLVSVGHTGRTFLFVQAQELPQPGLMRFWIHAFSCKSEPIGQSMANRIIMRCTEVRRAYQLAAKMGTAPKLSNRPNMRGAEFVAPGDHEGFTALPADQTMPGETTMAEREIDLIAMLGAEPAADAGGATSPLEVADQSMDVTLMALREMKELDTCLKSFNVADGLRGRLLVAFKGGYEAGGPVTEACGGDPAQLSVKLPDRTINAL